MGDITKNLLEHAGVVCDIADSMSKNRTAKEYFIEKVSKNNKGNTNNRAFFAEGALRRANLIAEIEFEQRNEGEETHEVPGEPEESYQEQDDGR